MALHVARRVAQTVLRRAGSTTSALRSVVSDGAGDPAKTGILSAADKHRFSQSLAGIAGNGVAGGAGARLAAAATDGEPLIDDVPPRPRSAAVRAIQALLGMGAVAAVGGAVWSYHTMDVNEVRTRVEALPPDTSAIVRTAAGWYLSAFEYVDKKVRAYTDASSDRLLPDQAPSMEHVRTLVLDLDETLIAADWRRERGWRVFKRPGVEDFLQNMAQYYEVVVYTSQLQQYADPILDKLDPGPSRSIASRLYRDATQYVGGEHVRDLSKLNRDLSKVIFVSSNPKAYALQPHNAIHVPPYRVQEGGGDPSADTALLDLMPFLEAIVTNRSPIADVRDVIKSFEGQDIPSTFRARTRELALRQREKARAARGGGFGRAGTGTAPPAPALKSLTSKS